MQKLVTWSLVLSAAILVVWIRTLPLSLRVMDDRADQVVRRQISNRVAQEVSQELFGSQWRAQVARQAAQWIDENPAQFEADKAAVSRDLKSQFTYDGPDGQEHVYLGGRDSYVWLRHARNILRTGTECDAVVEGECRDTYANAPVGAEMVYQRSLHTAAIVGVHRVITRFKPASPLAASAFLVPVIIGGLGVLPAFFIGRRLAGTIGGLFAAVLIGLNSQFLLRSIGSDNDVWNVVLPLYMLWMAVLALGAARLSRQVAYSVLMGAFVGLHTWAWRGGWPFTYAVVVCGLFGRLLFYSFSYAIHTSSHRVWQATEVRRTGLVLVVFWVAAGLGATLAGAEPSYLMIPVTVLEAVVGSPGGAGEVDYWPDALITVGELLKPNLGAIAVAQGTVFFLFVGLLGLLLLMLPKHAGWPWRYVSLLLGGSVLYRYLITAPGLSRSMTIGLIAVPLAAALVLHLADQRDSDDVDGGTWIVVCWFLAGLYLAFSGVRFFILMAPPLGIAIAVAAGRLYAEGRDLARRTKTRYRRIAVRVLLVVVLALLIIRPVQWGYATARNYTPDMHDAWWQSLSRIAEESGPDAIVNTWWDYGHWVKYVAQRRVSNDGSSLLTHVPHWLGRALMAPTERESIGVLRMLNCGSDATPLPEGRLGAYGKVRATGRDPITAYTIVAALLTLDKPEARSHLAQHGFSAPQQDSILQSTHCEPPEAYFIVSSREPHTAPAWARLGLWDFRRAYIAKRARELPQAEAVADLIQRFGYTEKEAAELYTQARTATSPGQLRSFIGPPQNYFEPTWLPCRPAPDGKDMVCDVGVHAGPEESRLVDFVYNPTSPSDARLRAHQPGDGFVVETRETPAVVILAGAERMEEIAIPTATYPDLGVLVDLPNQRILVGSPSLLRSTFTQLFYLDGRYATQYEKFDDRSIDTDRAVIWKINWGG